MYLHGLVAVLPVSGHVVEGSLPTREGDASRREVEDAHLPVARQLLSSHPTVWHPRSSGLPLELGLGAETAFHALEIFVGIRCCPDHVVHSCLA